MMNKRYQKPNLRVVCIENAHIVCGSIKRVESNAGLTYGGGGNGAARVKEQKDYNVWNDDWSE